MEKQQPQNIFTRLVAAQSDFKNVRQDNKAQAFGNGRGYAYANISDVLDAVRPVLNKHGLAVIQRTTTENDRVGIETVIFSQEGENISSGVFYVGTAGLTQKGVQAFGSAVTYARRYSLVSFLGLAYGDKDDDGAEASAEAYTVPQPHNAAQKTAAPQLDTAALEAAARTYLGNTVENYSTFFKALTHAEKTHLTQSGLHEKIKASLTA